MFIHPYILRINLFLKKTCEKSVFWILLNKKKDGKELLNEMLNKNLVLVTFERIIVDHIISIVLVLWNLLLQYETQIENV